MAVDDKTRTELEAAVFRRLVEHLRARSDVQNIDLMNLAGFCRNCLSNWLKDEADAAGTAMTKDESREAVYGMPYETWKSQHQGIGQSRTARGDEKRPQRALSVSSSTRESVKQQVSFPGRGAASFTLLRRAGIHCFAPHKMDPGSAAHRQETLRCVRGTQPLIPHPEEPRACAASRRMANS